MKVESTLGEGSVFSFLLSLEAFKESEHPRTRTQSADLPPLRVLIAEDNVINQKVAAGLLRRHGHEVEIAANGALAVASYKQGQFDLILMDVQMPEMNGYEATRAIRQQQTAHIKIIGLTANASENHRQLCLDAGMDGYVAKPFAWEVLAITIAGLINERRQGVEQGPSSEIVDISAA